MKLAVLSDIHGNLPALEAVVTDAREAGCDAFCNLGDSLSGPLWPAETCDLLMHEDWPTIAGNHERQLLYDLADHINASDAFARAALDARQKAWLRSQPATLSLTHDIFLCHGTPASDVEHFLFTVADAGLREATEAEVDTRAGGQGSVIILCGHTHLQRSVTLDDGRYVANPGSVGLQAFQDDRPAPYVVENDDPLARYAIVADGAVVMRSVAYDHLAAARRAQANGRPDWAIALATGRAH